MRINVYTEEMILVAGEKILDAAQPTGVEIVKAKYVSSRTGEEMTNYGLRIFLKSHPDLHYVPPRDDDRSAITFWCGSKERNIFEFLQKVQTLAYQCTLNTWHDKTTERQTISERAVTEHRQIIDEITDRLYEEILKGNK